ncbi:MAG: ABC transporter six-transmembrane domain-containing protein [Cytophagales bacterium]|nr:ABC transporter six-transmembrane domain-containing protein [Cytophagales bacterium]
MEVGEASAGKVLRDIVKEYPGKLSITGGLVLAENGLELLYPVIAGVALDAVLEGNLSTAFIMMAIIFTFWLVGALRRAIDTRVYTHIYKELVGKVIQSERKQGLPPSSTVVHAGLARQFVDFFEIQVPAFVTAIVSVAGAVIMLVILEPLIGGMAAAALLISVLTGFRYVKKSETFAEWLHDVQEDEPRVITKGTPLTISRHFHVIGGRRIQLSDLEAKAYLGIGLMAAILFGGLFLHLGTKGGVTAGHLFTLINYVWTFVENLDKMPEQLQQIGKLRELGTRINPDS